MGLRNDKIAVVNVDTIAAYAGRLASQINWLYPKCWQLLGTVMLMHALHELCELLQWPFHDGSTVYFVMSITVNITISYIISVYCFLAVAIFAKLH